MRDALVKMGADPKKANPLIPVDLVIDHSVQVDQFGTKDAFAANALIEYQRNPRTLCVAAGGDNRRFRISGRCRRTRASFTR